MSAEAFIDFAKVFPPRALGPTWQRDSDTGMYVLPERTLGWEVAGWCGEYLLNPRSDIHDPQPWRFTNEQLRFILWWYAVDGSGRFIYRSGVLQRLKGWGKDPLLAVISLVEMCGPSRFSHWDDEGNAVGKPHPAAWVQVAAVSREQTKNTMTMFPLLMSDHFRTEYRIESGQEIIRANGGRCRLEAVTSSYRSLEGGRSTFVLLNETQHWVAGNGGIKMYETVDGNTAKGGNRYLAITNAYLPGEGSVAERMRGAYVEILEGRALDFGSLYDSIEAHPKTSLDPDTLRLVIPLIRGDAVWVNPEDVIASVMKADIAPARSRRMWLNQIVADADALYEEDDWDQLLRPGQRLLPGDVIVLGFDGGWKDDATALVAIRVEDGLAQALLVEERPSNWPRGKEAPPWEVDRIKVDAAIHEAFATYTVVAFYADVALWDSYIAEWSAHYGPQLKVRAGDRSAVAWDMRGSVRRTASAHELLMHTIMDAKVCHGGVSATPLNDALRRHLLNARRRETSWGLTFRKESEDSPLKVDAYAALMLAHEALNDYRQRGKKDTQRTGRAWFF